MKFAIIAAGDGSRLAQEGITDPKPLVRVGEERLIDRLVRIFMANDATEIAVVCNEHMPAVAQHLSAIQREGLYGQPVPLHYVVQSTPSSMHSFHALRNFLQDEPFILTTVDTVFDERIFHDYVSSFLKRITQGADALMGVTDYIDDEKPLYVGVDEDMRINGYYDTDRPDSRFISAGIYGLTPRTLSVLERCVEQGESRMRNFQRALVAEGLQIEAFLLPQVFDVDHAEDIRKAASLIPPLPKERGWMNSDSVLDDEKECLLIQRAERFSPNSVEKDLAILLEVGSLLENARVVREEDLTAFFTSCCQAVPSARSASSTVSCQPPAVNCQLFSMARTPEAMDCLEQLEKKGVRVINPTAGVRACRRSNIEKVMRDNHLPLPPDEGTDGYWIKRGDAAAQCRDDVRFCRDEGELAYAKDSFVQRGIQDVVVQAHVQGDLVKFYGVEGTGFFRCYYPGDDDRTKFGDDQVNGRPQHYPFSSRCLQADAEKLSRLLQTPVYGGDVIIKRNSDYVIIDFNDWPSFLRCREEAARAIVKRAASALLLSSQRSN